MDVATSPKPPAADRTIGANAPCSMSSILLSYILFSRFLYAAEGFTSLFDGARGLNTLMSKYMCSVRPSHRPLAAMSRRTSFGVFDKAVPLLVVGGEVLQKHLGEKVGGQGSYLVASY